MTSLESMFSGDAIIYEASLFRVSQEQSPPLAAGIHQRALGKQESSMHCGSLLHSQTGVHSLEA